MSVNDEPGRAKLRPWEMVALAVILLIATLTRTIGLGRVPPGLSADELANSLMAERVLDGERPIWFEESFGHEPLYHYAQAVTMRLAGFNVWGIVLPSVVAGVLAAWLAYALGRRTFGPPVGLVAAAGLAVTWWPIFFSRVGLRIIGLAPLATATVYALWRGLETAGRKERSERPRLVKGSFLDRHVLSRVKGLGVLPWFWFLLASALLAAGLYTYSAAKALPAALAAFVLYLAIFYRERLHRSWLCLLLAAILAVGLFWPLYRHLQTHDTADTRTTQISAPLVALRDGDPKPILENTLATLGMFGFAGDPKWRHNVAGRAAFTPVGAVLFYGGLLLAVWRWRQPRCALLLLWWAAGLLPGITTVDAPSSNRLIVSLVPTYLLAALGMVEVGRWTVARWRRTMPAVLVAGVAVIAWEGSAALVPYLGTWPDHPQVRDIYQATLTDIMHYLDAHAGDAPVCIGEPFVYDNYLHLPGHTLRRADPAAIRWFNPASALVLPAGGASAYYVLPHYAPPADPVLAGTWFAGQMPKATGKHHTEAGEPAYVVYRLDVQEQLTDKLSALAVTGPVWTSGEVEFAPDPLPGTRQPHELPVDLGHQLAFLGYELSTTEVRPGNWVTVLTYWRVLAPVDPPLAAVFVHLLDGHSQVYGQHDGLGTRSPEWQPEDVIVQLHRFQIAPDAPPGHYWLELGAYTWVNWERLQVYEGDAAVGDRLLLQEMAVR
jgi:4-amino-4-deoxy-L-arabinose transferase-like glycosyltransferase